MDVRDYLEKQKRRIGERARRVKDFSVFDFNHVPEEPLMREECRELIDAMLRFDATGVPTHLAVVGSRGCGKTLTLKHLQRLIPQQTDANVLYANCRHHSTSYKIFTNLLEEPATGDSLMGLYERFAAKHPDRTVLVLDEVDLMSPKDRRREILYLISRSERPYMVVMLSNSPQPLRQLDAATRSSLQPMPLHFRGYDAEQLRLILEDRARRGLRDWDPAALAQIAALTVKRTNADARVAIKTLFYTVTRPSEGLDECFEAARRDIVIDMINDLADANLLILRAAATCRSDLAKDIYERYCRFSHEQREKPFSYVHFYSNLSYMQSMGLIALVSTKVDRVYTNRIQLTFDPAVATDLCELRFG